MDIFFNNNLLLSVEVNDNSYSYHQLMGEDKLILYFSLPEYVRIPAGSTCVFDNKKYRSFTSCNIKKIHNRNFEYTLTMLGAGEAVRNYILRENPAEDYDVNIRRNIKFSYTGTLSQHVKLLVYSLTERSDMVWHQGSVIETEEKCLYYNATNCLDALNYIASEFDTEWEIIDNSVCFHKIEYYKDNPLPLSYGFDNGFKSGVCMVSEAPPVRYLFVQGGDRNIDPSRYNYSRNLLMPSSASIGFDGSFFDHQDGYNPNKATIYQTDEFGFYLYEQGAPYNGVDGSVDLSSIYPKYTGKITSVNVVDATRNFYDIVDIYNNVDFNNYLIAGDRLRIIFQNGMLEGREFEVKYYHIDKRFEIVPTEIDGVVMPNNIFCPTAGNSYSVFGMMLPDEYICNSNDKTGASWDMFREAVVYLHERRKETFTFSGELDGIWAKRQWSNVSNRILVGGYVNFSDTHFQQEPILMRIIGVKKFVNNPYSPQIEISNAPLKKPITVHLAKIHSLPIVEKRLEDFFLKNQLFLEHNLSIKTGVFDLPKTDIGLKKGRIYVDEKTGSLKITR